MKTFFSSLLGTLVALFLFVLIVPFLFVGIIMSLASSASGPVKHPSAIVLEIDLREGLADQPATQGPAVLFQNASFLDTLRKIDAAASDDKVKGIYIRANEMGIGSSRAEELRDVLHKFRAADKFVIAHSQGMIASGPSSLRAIAASDELWLQPGADILVNGISFETMFMKDLFDNLSVTAEIEQFHEYKNAPNVYKQTDYTSYHREAMTALASDLWTISIKDIAEDRGFADPQALRTLLEKGPMSAQEAVDSKLFTGLKWPEDAKEDALKRAGVRAEIVPVAQYMLPAAKPDAPIIAVIGGEGAIVTGKGEQGLFDSEAIFASDRIAEALLKAGRDKNVKAIVFRVDSPGGSAIASDQIWRAVERVRNDMGKPVIVSMGSVAASGGYYVSAGADAILASRTTITGSIGVFGGKFAIADGLRKIGINPSSVAVGGEFATAFSTEKFTDTQRAQLRESLQRTYDRFMTIVADGRDLPETRVREIAKGRVWSGSAAAELSLVSEIGGFLQAVEKAKTMAKLDAGTDVNVAIYPAPESPFEAFSDFFGASAETSETAMKISKILEDDRFQMLLDQAAATKDRGTQMSAPIVKEN